MATDETYWKDNLIDAGFNDFLALNRMTELLGVKKSSSIDFDKLLSFMIDFQYLDSGNFKEFYEVEVYSKDNVYFVSPALKKIVIKRKSFINKYLGIIGDIASRFWRYEFVNGSWKIFKEQAEVK